MKAIALMLPVLSVLAATAVGADSQRAPWAGSARTLIEEFCSDCHDSDERKGGLDLTTLTFSPTDATNFQTWVKGHDRLATGETPPKNKPPPAATEIEAFVTQLAASLSAHESEVAARQGRATQRRLNRTEYENALRDLLDAPWLQVKEQLPEDGDAFHF